MPRPGKQHRLVIREERGTQDWGPQVHQVRQQAALRLVEDSYIRGSQYLWTLQTEGACCCLQTPETRKISGIGFHLPRVHTPHRFGSQILVLCLPHFLHAPTQDSKYLEKITNNCDPKARKATGDPKSYRLKSLLCVPLKSSRDSSTLVSMQSLTHCSLGSRRALDTGCRSWTKSPCWHRISRIAFRLRRSKLCLSTSQQPTTLHGTAASPASCCDCCLIDIWSAWSWRWLAIAASPSPPETAKGAGYDASRAASHTDLSWHAFSSTFTSLTCQPPSP